MMRFTVLDFCNLLFCLLFAVCAFSALGARPYHWSERKNPANRPSATIKDYQPEAGDIILTRNPDNHPERETNPTPGYWNHAAIVAEIDGQMVVVEVQKRFPTVVAFHINNFLARYPEAVVLRPLTKQAERNSVAAQTKIGDFNNYRFAASLRLWIVRTDVRRDNCVSFVRKCYQDATGRDYCWMKPDHIYQSRERSHLKIVAAKNDLRWSPPDDYWSGKVDIKSLTKKDK